MGLDLNATIRASANNLKIVLLKEWLNVWSIDKHTILGLTTARVEEPNRILKMVINILSIDWHFNVVVLLFESGECCQNLDLFIGFEECFLRLELNFVLVLVRYLPFVLERNSGFILHGDLLFLADTFENGREEEFVFV